MYPEPGTSEIVVGNALYSVVEDINESLPPDLDLFILFDNSRYMREAVADFQHAGRQILLVGLVVLALMGSARSALVLPHHPHLHFGCNGCDITIGFSMNLLTILAIVLGRLGGG